MKKLSYLKILMCVLMFTISFSLMACSHTHKFGEWQIIKPATCTEDGLMQRKCKKDDTVETKTISKFGHDLTEWFQLSAATCTEDEVLKRECKNCTYTETSLGKLAHHSFGEWNEIIKANCDHVGEATRECSVCGEIETNVIPKTSHALSNWLQVQPATCFSVEILRRSCSNCDYFENKFGTTYLPHTYNSWEQVSPATCTSVEVSKRTCKFCTHYETKNGSTLLAHVYNDWFQLSPANCTNSEVLKHVCKNCEHYETKKGAVATGHSFTGWTLTSEPTCSTYGVETRSCNKCEKTETRNGSTLLPHVYGEWYELSPATCVKSQILKHECNNCSHYETMNSGDSLGGHLMGSWQQQSPATCTSEEILKRTCSRCSYKETKTGAEKLNHFYSEWEEVIAPSCVHTGTLARICLVCDKHETKPGDSYGDHSFTNWQVTIPKTCIHYETQKRKCLNCTLEETNVGTELGDHVFEEWHTHTPVTCTTNEILERFCEICSNRETTTGTLATGHDYYSTITNPTQNTLGFTTHTCKNCSNNYNDSYTCLITYEGDCRVATAPQVQAKIVNKDSTFESLNKLSNFNPITYKVNGTEIDESYVVNSSITVNVTWKTDTEVEFDSTLLKIKKLEELSASYNSSNKELRVLQYIMNRYYTGSDKSLWKVMCGTPDAGFETYVTSNQGNINVASLRSIPYITIPTTNEEVDIVHMFATMSSIFYNIVYSSINIENIIGATKADDVTGWAGDLVTLVQDLVETGYTGDALQAEAYRLLGASKSVDSQFRDQDLYADLDTINIYSIYKNTNATSISSVMEDYYYNKLQDRKTLAITNAFSSELSSGTIEQKAEKIVNRIKQNDFIEETFYTSLAGVTPLAPRKGVSTTEHAEQFKAAAIAFVTYLTT